MTGTPPPRLAREVQAPNLCGRGGERGEGSPKASLTAQSVGAWAWEEL